jgi:hypothetical protein
LTTYLAYYWYKQNIWWLGHALLVAKPRHRSVGMFGALNRFIGRLDAEPTSHGNTQNPGDNTFGFQVLKNTSPELQLEPWFDFIIGINGHFIVGSTLG